MKHYKLLGDVHAHACAHHCDAVAVVALIEKVEYVGQVVVGHSCSIILDDKFHLAVKLIECDGDGAAARGKFEGVEDIVHIGVDCPRGVFRFQKLPQLQVIIFFKFI